MKAAKSLFDNNDERVRKYKRDEMMNILSDNRYHSEELSESGGEGNTEERRNVNVYNPSWRSDEV